MTKTATLEGAGIELTKHAPHKRVKTLFICAASSDVRQRWTEPHVGQTRKVFKNWDQAKHHAGQLLKNGQINKTEYTIRSRPHR